MPSPRIAVVIPCHDDGDLVTEAVASVREDEPVEIVVVDDGSSDGSTLAALERLRAGGVRVVRQENAGPGAARMAGVAATTAPYVFPLDADDLLLPGALGRLAGALDRDPEAAVAWGDYEIFGDGRGRYRAPTAWPAWSLTYVNQIPISSLLRRSALLEAGGWPDHGYEDWGLWLRFVELGLHGVHGGIDVYRRRLRAGQGRVLVDRGRHHALYEDLRRRYAGAFAARPELLRQERPPLVKRLVYPVLFGSRRVVPLGVEAWMQRTMLRYGLRLSR